MDPKIDEQSKKLEILGNELTKIQFDFKLKYTPSKKYWTSRIEEFKIYHEKVTEYFSQAYFLMKVVDNDQSAIFLFRLSKLKQIGIRLIENMEKVRENPSIMNVKDKQQSKWSLENKEQLINSNNECLNHEKKMNVFFREFYEQKLKQE